MEPTEIVVLSEEYIQSFYFVWFVGFVICNLSAVVFFRLIFKGATVGNFLLVFLSSLIPFVNFVFPLTAIIMVLSVSISTLWELINDKYGEAPNRPLFKENKRKD